MSYFLASSFVLKMGRAESPAAMGSSAKWCCPERKLQRQKEQRTLGHMFVSASTAFLSLSLPARLSQNRLDKYPPACQHRGAGAAENRYNPSLRSFLVYLRCATLFKLVWLSWEIFKLPFSTVSAQCVVCNTPAFVSVSWRAQLSLTLGQCWPAVTAGQECVANSMQVWWSTWDVSPLTRAIAQV